MKSPLVLTVDSLSVAASLHAQTSATPPALGLLRLKSATRPNDAAPLAAGKFGQPKHIRS